MEDNYGGNFDLFGYSSTLALVNYGDIWLAILIFIVCSFLFKIGEIVFKKFQRFPKIQKYFKENAAEIKYNGILRLLLEIYLDVCLFGLINVIKMKFLFLSDFISNIVTMLIMVVIIGYPIWVFRYVQKYKDRLNEETQV